MEHAGIRTEGNVGAAGADLAERVRTAHKTADVRYQWNVYGYTT